MKNEVYWIAAFVGSKERNLGIVMTAGEDAPDEIRGKKIFYRLLTWGEDVVMRRDNSIGFSKPAFDHAVSAGVRYIVTYAKQSGDMNIAHVDAFSFERNYGQGLQKRAKIDDTVSLNEQKGLLYPTAIDRVFVKGEDGKAPELKPANVQPELPASAPRGTRRKCGCYFLDGQIEKPCPDHDAMWRPVIERLKGQLGAN